MKSIRSKLLWSHTSLAFLTAMVTPFAMTRFMEGQLLDSLERQLRRMGEGVSISLARVWDPENNQTNQPAGQSERSGEPGGPGPSDPQTSLPAINPVYQQALQKLSFTASAMGGWIHLLDSRARTIVGVGGTTDPPFNTRREIRSALRGSYDSRLCDALPSRAGSDASESEPRDLCIALPVKDGNRVVGVAYLGAPSTHALEAMPGVRLRLAVASLLGFTVAYAFAMVMSSALARPVLSLTGAAGRVAAGDFSVREPKLSSDELGTLTEAFNAMAERLQRVDEERRAFLADVAHEFRTPLTAIKGSAETLSGMTPGEAGLFARNIVQQTDRLDELVADLLHLARLESGAVSMDRAPVDLRELAEQVCGELRTLAEERRVQLVVAEGRAEGATITGDPTHLARVFINVIGNALRYAPADSKVTVRVEQSPDQMAVEVIDSGPGISPEHLPHIFERFYRADAARSRDDSAQGSGLGLSIARRIVEAHGGRISARSQVGEGTTIRIELRRDT